jgi:hypothetical protein
MKKILFLVALAITLTAGYAQQGEIIYTEFYPDSCKVVYYPDSMSFDVNYDGTLDFWFNGIVEIGALVPRIIVNDGWEFCIVTEAVLLTDDSLSWYGNGEWWQWFNDYHMQYGFRRLEEGEYYYAWIDVSVDYYEQPWNQAKVFCVSGMAYCSIPNYPLKWGQTSLTGVEENNESIALATFYPNPTNGIVTITGENLRQAEVLNMLGQKMLNVQDKGNELHIDMATLPAGIYFVTVIDEKGKKCVRKVMKE